MRNASMDRRRFAGLLSGGAAVAASGCSAITDLVGGGGPRLDARPHSPSNTIAAGRHALDFGDDRDGFLFVPAAAATSAVPLLVMFHGAAASSSEFNSLTGQADGQGFALLAPDARGQLWDFHSGYGPDVRFINKALSFTFDHVAVRTSRIAVGGFSDGATYALTMALDNGDLFGNAMAFSPATYFAEEPHGRPKIFISHGSADSVIPVSASRDVIVPRLRSAGYDVTYEETQGGHALLTTSFRHAIDWWAIGE